MSKFFDNMLTRTCDACPTLCAECESLTHCTSCIGGYIINTLNNLCICAAGYFEDGLESCTLNCPVGEYPNLTTHMCTDCHSDCTICTGAGNNVC